jgi:uncharacterized HAD superfamily protein
LTVSWLGAHAVPYDGLELDLNTQGKISYIEELKVLGYNPVLMFEDWAPAAQAVRERCGIPVLTINPEYPDMCTCGYVQFEAAGGG